MQGLPITSDCDADIMGQCMRAQGLDSFGIGQVKACLVDLGVPKDPSIVLAAEVSPALQSLHICFPLHIRLGPAWPECVG